MVRVRDEGNGIPLQDLPFIFQRFHRGSNVSEDTPGTGLGLATMHQLSRQLGGRLRVTSAEGVGSTFQARLPLPAGLRVLAQHTRTIREQGQVLLAAPNPLSMTER